MKRSVTVESQLRRLFYFRRCLFMSSSLDTVGDVIMFSGCLPAAFVRSSALMLLKWLISHELLEEFRLNWQPWQGIFTSLYWLEYLESGVKKVKVTTCDVKRLHIDVGTSKSVLSSVMFTYIFMVIDVIWWFCVQNQLPTSDIVYVYGHIDPVAYPHSTGGTCPNPDFRPGTVMQKSPLLFTHNDADAIAGFASLPKSRLTGLYVSDRQFYCNKN